MIYILRHGETALNSLNVLQGRSDHPLNETGIRQAEAAARLLRERGVTFDLVFSSPLVRALETARIVAPEAAPVIDGRLIEMDYGPYEGAGLASLPPEVLTFFRDFIHNPRRRAWNHSPPLSRGRATSLRTYAALTGTFSSPPTPSP